jgi:hypothetical protein
MEATRGELAITCSRSLSRNWRNRSTIINKASTVWFQMNSETVFAFNVLALLCAML